MKRVGGLFLYAILAGFCIGLGGTVFLKLKDAFPGGNVVGALLFTIGLFTVCTRGYALFTGKACYLFDNPLPAYLLDLLVFWVGNLLGAMLIAGLEHLTGMVGGETGIDATAAALVEGKMGATYLGLFVLGILCNICIFIAVNGYANNPHQVGKYLALFLGVSVLILCGTEHSVADMYYWSVSGVLYAQPGESVLRLLIISLGNVVGGVFFPLMEKGSLFALRSPAAPEEKGERPMVGKEDIYRMLREEEIWHEITEHPAVYNMEEMAQIKLPYPEADAKNLFVRDSKRRDYYLITVRGDKRVDLKQFRQQNQTRSLSFASAEELGELLGLIPGAVTPLGLLNDGDRRVSFYLDASFCRPEAQKIGVHPNDNTALCRILFRALPWAWPMWPPLGSKICL